MKEVTENGKLLTGIYDAALEPDLWPDVLDRLRRLVDCRSGGILHGTLNPMTLTVKGATGFDPVVMERARDILDDPTGNPFFLNMTMLEVGVPVPRQKFLDDETFEKHRIYRDFFEPQDLFHDITTPLSVSPDEAITLYLGRGRKAGPLEQREVRILLPWIPHLQRAMQIDRQMRMHRAGNLVLSDILDRMPFGVVLAGRDGEVMSMNRAAERIVGAGDGFECKRRRLVARSRSDNAALNRVVALAAGGQGGGSLRVRRYSGARPYPVFAAPLSRAVSACWPRSPEVAILFSDTEDDIEAPFAALAQLYGLSPAETAVAIEAAKGIGIGAVAEKLGIGANTVKTHLSRVFEKTGTRRQAELVRLVLAGRPVMLDISDR